MSEAILADQVPSWDLVGNAGVSEVKTVRLDGPIRLASGRELPYVDVAYETYGELSKGASNAVLICHALSGDAHVAGFKPGEDPETGKPGWWDPMVGPGKAVDTEKYFVICSNVLGGCSGTTGPGSIDPETGRPYRLNFPMVTIEDMVDVQARLVEHLGIDKLLAVVGGSMGGMQALAWCVRYPERVRAVVADATTPNLGAQAISFNAVGRRAILSDPAFKGGEYEEQPEAGLAIARMIGHITYLSNKSMHSKFGRRLRESDEYAYGFVQEFEVETYLEHQGASFVDRFDANTYLYMTKAMDYFDLANGSGDLATALAKVKARFLVTSFSSDWLFPTSASRALVSALRAVDAEVSFAEIESPYGHDAFLLEPEAQTKLITPFLAATRKAVF